MSVQPRGCGYYDDMALHAYATELTEPTTEMMKLRRAKSLEAGAPGNGHPYTLGQLWRGEITVEQWNTWEFTTQGQRCVYWRNSDNLRCGQPALRTTEACRRHGAHNSPHVRAKVKYRAEMLAAGPGLTALAELITSRSIDPNVRLKAVKEVLNRAGITPESMAKFLEPNRRGPASKQIVEAVDQLITPPA